MTVEPQTLAQQAVSLVEHIYSAALDPPRWRDFSQAMVELHPNTAVGFALQLPGPSPGVYYGAGFGTELEGQWLETFIRHSRRGLPWEEARRQNFVGRFGLASEVFPDEAVRDTDFYREWMEPLGLAPVAPMGHTIALDEDRPVASVALFRKGRDGAPFQRQDLALGDLLVPHLARAYALHAQVRENAALAEVLDRLPSGVLLVDARHAPVLTNRTARLVFALDDGISCDASGPRARDPSEDALLQKLIGEAIAAAGGPRDELGAVASVMAISRPSGRRAFPVMVSPLLSAPAESALRDAVAVMHIADLEAQSIARSDVLHVLYGLTQAEVELVALLCDGCSLEEAAARRGVTMNTARSQLKKIFAKTGTSRQSELVRLVLAGIAPIGDPR